MGILKGALAGVGCIAMQIPYGLAEDPEEVGAVGEILTTAMPLSVATDWDGYSNHWWWDNLAHYLAGYAIGSFLSPYYRDERKVIERFVQIAALWEGFEYVSQERPWHTDENGDMVWEWDHAMEDTVLDTIVGTYGAYVAATE